MAQAVTFTFIFQTIGVILLLAAIAVILIRNKK